jgi:hypothetical protein
VGQRGTVRAGNFTFSMEKKTKIINWEQKFCTPQNRMSHIVFRVRRCNIIILSTNATIKEKSADPKTVFMRNYNKFSVSFLNTV